MGAAGKAEAERSRAASMISLGKFNEALTSLYAARNYFTVENNILKSARTNVDIADLLQWLGDYKRALDELDQAAKIYSQVKLRGRLDGIVDFVEKNHSTRT